MGKPLLSGSGPAFKAARSEWYKRSRGPLKMEQLQGLFSKLKALKSKKMSGRAYSAPHVSGSTLDIERVRRFSPSQQRTAARAMRRSV